MDLPSKRSQTAFNSTSFALLPFAVWTPHPATSPQVAEGMTPCLLEIGQFCFMQLIFQLLVVQGQRK